MDKIINTQIIPLSQTGSTMLCCYRMLKEGGLCNVLNLIGINNT